MPKIMRLLALVAGAAATIQPLAHGQSAALNGEITGTVTDPSGAAIAGAVIQISNPATGFKREIKAAESGLYRFTLLPLGTYDLLGQAVGFADARRSGVTVNAGATVTVNISLQIAGASTAIDVSTSTAITDPSRTDLGSTLDSNATQNLPLVSRNPYNFILFQPNVSGRANTEFGVPRRVNANGFNGRINYSWTAATILRATAPASGSFRSQTATFRRCSR